MQPSIAITLIVIFLISVYVCVVVPLLLLFYKYKGRTGAPTAYRPLNEVPCAHTTAYIRLSCWYAAGGEVIGFHTPLSNF